MTRKRFYDEEPATVQLVGLMLKFPDELQTLLAESLSRIAEEEYKAADMLKDHKSLGSEKILPLYKSKNKQRDYDKNPAFHRAMNYMMVMTPQNRQTISVKVLALMGHVQEYLKLCREKNVPPALKTLEKLVHVFVEEGNEVAKRYMAALQAETQSAPKSADEERQEAVKSEQLGMRITGKQ